MTTADEDLDVVVARLKEHKVWLPQRTEEACWTSLRDATLDDMLDARRYIEGLYDMNPSSLPGGDGGGRMMLRYLNSRIGPNTERSRSFHIRALSVHPRSVSLGWQDRHGEEHQWSLSESETAIFPEAIRKQMDNWAQVLCRISAGKFSLSYEAERSRGPLEALCRRESDGRHWLSPTPAKTLAGPRENVLLYVFWLPMWGDPPPMIGAAGYSGPQGPFPHDYIMLHTDQKRLLNPMGWVNLDGGLAHESWHFLSHLARRNGFEGPIARDDVCGRPDWELLKSELQKQGLPVPRYAHEEQYANTCTWSFVEKLRRAHSQ